MKTPTGKQRFYYTTQYPSPLGPITLASNGDALTGAWFAGQKYFGGTLGANLVPKEGLPVFLAAKNWLDRYFAGSAPDPKELPLSPAGTSFQQAVWDLLREIPYGTVVTYGDLARELAQRQGRVSLSPQAVGGAVGRNPLSVLIPCHRVVGAGGKLTGYAGGLEKKAWLLAHEGAAVGGK